MAKKKKKVEKINNQGQLGKKKETAREKMIGQTIGRTKLRIGLQICILMMMQSRGESADNAMVEHPECRLYLAESTIPHGACIALNNNYRCNTRLP